MSSPETKPVAPPYTVQLPIYQGPLDLLLALIERAELDISKVSCAKVTDQYLEYLRSIPEHSLEDVASFLVIAARLLQIKSESLLPRPPVREPGEEDPGDALARQLIIYKRFKEIAALLADRQKAGLRAYLRRAPVELPEPRLDLSSLHLEDLRQAMLQVLATSPSQPELNRIVPPLRIHIRDRINLILRNLRDRGRTSFRAVVSEVRSRLELVISFLAVLELIKQRQVVAQQEELFGDIELLPGENWKEDQEAAFDLEFD